MKIGPLDSTLIFTKNRRKGIDKFYSNSGCESPEGE
jgi:hypothetical protein